MKKIVYSRIIVVCFIGFVVNLGLEDVSVVKYAKTGKRAPESGSAGASGRLGPEGPDEPAESGESGESGTDIMKARTGERIYNRMAKAQDDNFLPCRFVKLSVFLLLFAVRRSRETL